MVRIDHAAAEGQTLKNWDTHRCHEKYIGKKINEDVEIAREEMGVFHQLAPELQESLIEARRSYKVKMRAYFDKALAA